MPTLHSTPLPLEAGWSGEARRIWSHYLPPRRWESLPSFPPRRPEEAGPLPILSMLRLCSLVDQTALPRRFIPFRWAKQHAPRRQSCLRSRAHAFAALRAAKTRNASSSANPCPFSLDLLSRLSRRRPCLRVAATMQRCSVDYPADATRCQCLPAAAGRSRKQPVPHQRSAQGVFRLTVGLPVSRTG